MTGSNHERPVTACDWEVGFPRPVFSKGTSVCLVEGSGLSRIDHLDLASIDRLTGGELGRHDAPCPLCGPAMHTRVASLFKTLRIWRLDPGFAGYHCAQCGEKGSSRDRSAPPPDIETLQRANVEAVERERIAASEHQQRVARLWAQREPIPGTDAETYLREACGYRGPLPNTLGFLRGHRTRPPAMIAAFGFPAEPEPGVIQIPPEALRGVHITLLTDGGRGDAGADWDRMIPIRRLLGSPIVLAPPNDLCGMVIATRIEDALSVHEATGLGAWAASAASGLPALAGVLPDFVQSVTVMVDDEPDGRRYAGELARLVERRGIEARPILLPQHLIVIG